MTASRRRQAGGKSPRSADRVGHTGPVNAGTLGHDREHVLEHVPAAFAVTRGADHQLIYSNAAFREITGSTVDALGGGIVGILATAGRDAGGLAALLNGVFRTGAVARERRIDAASGAARAWMCSVWPSAVSRDDEQQLIIELRVATASDLTLSLQRDVAERMLLSALQQRDIAETAESSRHRASFLASEGRRLSASLDETSTLGAISKLALPHLGAWCFVDVLGTDNSMRRLAIIHSDPAKQSLLSGLEGRWRPEPGDPFGLPAVLERTDFVMVERNVDAALAAAAHAPEVLRTLRDVGFGPLLSVPMHADGRQIGAITFVAAGDDDSFSAADVELAEDLAVRAAMSLDSAWTHAEALFQRTRAERANAAKSDFLGSMSHELRTPLNAIGGYVELIEMGLRGPVTAEMRADFERIRRNQHHLLAMINDILNFVRIDHAEVPLKIDTIAAGDAISGAVTLVESLITEHGLAYQGPRVNTAVALRADPDRLTQILINLLSNAIKFTPAGGRISVNCDATDSEVQLHVSDTGIGVPADKVTTIFEPFVQVRSGLSGRDSGAGLGLAISRGLARAMHGDLTMNSRIGHGSRFTLSLPRAAGAPGNA